jgi:hypothetical protein
MTPAANHYTIILPCPTQATGKNFELWCGFAASRSADKKAISLTGLPPVSLVLKLPTRPPTPTPGINATLIIISMLQNWKD